MKKSASVSANIENPTSDTPLISSFLAIYCWCFSIVIFLNDFFSSGGVENFPRKAAKKASRREASIVVVLRHTGTGKMLLLQRPHKG